MKEFEGIQKDLYLLSYSTISHLQHRLIAVSRSHATVKSQSSQSRQRVTKKRPFYFLTLWLLSNRHPVTTLWSHLGWFLVTWRLQNITTCNLSKNKAYQCHQGRGYYHSVRNGSAGCKTFIWIMVLLRLLQKEFYERVQKTSKGFVSSMKKIVCTDIIFL